MSTDRHSRPLPSRRTQPREARAPGGSRSLDALREAIIVGRLADGERLIEDRIARELKTSRGPVREALRQLEHEGLVVSYPYRGAVVLGVSDEEVHEVLIPIRLTLERFSFTKAAERMTEDDFAELAKEVWLMGEAARADDLLRWVEADIRFHEFVLSRSGQPHTTQVWRSDRAAHPRLLLPLRPLGRPRRGSPSSTATCSTALQSRDHGRSLRRARSSGTSPSGAPGPRDRAAARREPAHLVPHRRRADPRRRRGRLRARVGPHARRRRRVGQRQVGDRALDHAPDRRARAEIARGQPDPLRGPRPRRRSASARWRRCAATRSR